MTSTNGLVIKANNLTKIYLMGEIELYALRDVSLQIAHGELVSIMGSSGSGKSTLMNILGCLDQPTSGEYYLEDVMVNDLDDNRLSEIHLLDLTTGERKRLTKSSLLASPQHNSAAPTWSPDGQQISFLTDRTGAWEIWVMNSDGSNQHSMFPADVQAQLNLRYDGMNERMLSWSP